MNPWQTWLQAVSQQQKSFSQSGNWQQSYAQACTQWQTAAEGVFASPAAYWQTVSSIMSARAKFITEFYQQQPAYIAQLCQCTTFPQVVECLTRWNGHTLASFTTLNTTTQAQRSHLLAQWQQQMPFLKASPSALGTMWNTYAQQATKQAQSFTQQAQGTTQQPKQAQPANQTASTPAPQAAPGVSSHTSYTPAQPIVPQTAQTAQASVAQALPTSATVSAPVATPAIPSSSQLNLITPQAASTTTTETTGQISPTANSVMRTATGSTVASAAAAARRSVVARRTANNRRRAIR